MKSSFHSLIPFLPLFCNCQLHSVQFLSSQAHILAGWSVETRPVSTEIFFIATLHGPRRKRSLFDIEKACLQRRCTAKEVIPLLFASLLPREYVYGIVA
jgi:hypothetical protein